MSSTDVNVQLVINEMSKTKYESLLSSNEINDNELYLVKEENIDAYDKTIVNVADPVNATDAVNKQYIDNALKETIMSSRIVGEIFYTSRLDVLDDGGKVLNGAVPCNGKIWTDGINIDNSILGLLKNGKLPYVSMQEYDNILNAQNGVCHVFGWNGADTVRVPTLNDVFIESSIIGDNISGFTLSSDVSGNIVYDEDGNMISSFNGYLEAGIPKPSVDESVQVLTSFSSLTINSGSYHNGGSNFVKDTISFNYPDVYREDVDTVQPRAIRYIPMVQFYNNIDESVIINYDNLVEKCNEIIANVQDSVNELKLNSVQAGHMLGEIFYTTRLDVLEDGGKIINGAVPCNGKIISNIANLASGILELLQNNSLPHTTLENYEKLLKTQNGVCHVFGWDGADTVRVPMLNDVFIEASVTEDNISGFVVSSDVSGNIVYDEDGNMISSFNGYLEAGLPNITGTFYSGSHAANQGTLAFGTLNAVYSGATYLADGTTGKRVLYRTDATTCVGSGLYFNALSGETNVDGTLKTEDEYHVYGKSDTVQPRAIRYIPMVQFYNMVDESVVTNYDNLVEKCNEIIANVQDSVNELKLNSIQAGHMLGEVFYTTRLDVLEDGGKIINGAVPCNGKIISNIADLTSGILELLQNNSLPHTTLENYEKLLETQNGVCHVFGWDGADTVRVPTLNDIFIEASIDGDNISGFTVSSDVSGNIVYDEDGNMISSFNGYLEAGLPNITGKLEKISDGHSSASGNDAFTVTSLQGYAESGGSRTNYGYQIINFNASLSNPVYGNSDTVQPRAIRYIPMVQFYNMVDESAVTNYDDLVVKYTNIMTDMQTSTNELKEALVDADLTSYVKISDINSYIYTPGQLTEISNISINATSEQPSNELSTTITGPCYVYGTTAISGYSGWEYETAFVPNVKVEIFIDDILIQSVMSHVYHDKDGHYSTYNYKTSVFTNNACSIFIPATKTATIKTSSYYALGTAKVYTM